MAKIEEFLSQWRDAREGLIKEVERIPEDNLDFRAAAETRSVLELLYHVIESERMLVGEICRDDTDLRRLLTRPPDAEVRVVTTKNAIIALLRSSLVASHETVRRFGAEKLEELMSGLDGKQVTKAAMLQFTLAHEMYHRGQLTVYQRLLGIEPALTEQFRQLTSPKQ
ncbi:MAG TPA: DinB family protein [Blastocatellia bacterium]|nr:DinB family protein [Blastocatellia bacterium]